MSAWKALAAALGKDLGWTVDKRRGTQEAWRQVVLGALDNDGWGMHALQHMWKTYKIGESAHRPVPSAALCRRTWGTS